MHWPYFIIYISPPLWVSPKDVPPTSMQSCWWRVDYSTNKACRGVFEPLLYSSTPTRHGLIIIIASELGRMSHEVLLGPSPPCRITHMKSCLGPHHAVSQILGCLFLRIYFHLLFIPRNRFPIMPHHYYSSTTKLRIWSSNLNLESLWEIIVTIYIHPNTIVVYYYNYIIKKNDDAPRHPPPHHHISDF